MKTDRTLPLSLEELTRRAQERSRGIFQWMAVERLLDYPGARLQGKSEESERADSSNNDPS